MFEILHYPICKICTISISALVPQLVFVQQEQNLSTATMDSSKLAGDSAPLQDARCLQAPGTVSYLSRLENVCRLAADGDTLVSNMTTVSRQRQRIQVTITGWCICNLRRLGHVYVDRHSDVLPMVTLRNQESSKITKSSPLVKQDLPTK